MEYFISEDKSKVIGFDGENVVQFKKLSAGGGEPLEVEVKKERKTRVKKEKAAYGAKGEAIRKLLDKDLSVKDIVVKLQEEFPTLTPSDVYQERAKLKKAQSSDTFTGRPNNDE